jgi:glucosamine kinase
MQNVNNSENIFIGVDGGASKCRVRVEDAHGNCLGEGRAGHASLKVSVDDAWNTIMSTVIMALQHGGGAVNPDLLSILHNVMNGEANGDAMSLAASSLLSKYQLHIGCGLTGTELPQPFAEFMDKAPPCFATVSLNSDAYTACLGAHGGNDGAIIVIGTGTVGVQIQCGKVSKVGAWGFPHGDEGGAAWIGMEAVRLISQWLDGRASFRDDSMLVALFNHFDNDATKLIVWANAANSTEFAKITPIVIDYLHQDNQVAFMLIKKAAEEIDKIGAALERKCGEGHGQLPLPCALLGGLAQFVEPWLGGELRARVVPPQYDATVGAILMVKHNYQGKDK